ncbi:MAG: glucose 1-dehydrogenase [Chloroflexi bacterium]|nr:MAG: glucose 1-dehydrogenase [Chloroflexota bacterium]
MRLKDKVALVTGGGSGIGRACAELFAEEGARVVVADYNAQTGEACAKAITDAGRDAVFTSVDVSDATQVGAMVETALSTYGQIDVLFNGAGILLFGTALETSEADWNRVMAVNLTGTFLCCKAVLPHMIERGGGSIVNVSSSTGAHDAGRNTVAYVTSKGGVMLMTRALAIDYAQHNIRVNALCPGPTDTPMLHEFFSPEQLEAFANTFPMKRLGRPEELAYAALFLASDEASFVTGAMLAADGGQTAEV